MFTVPTPTKTTQNTRMELEDHPINSDGAQIPLPAPITSNIKF